MFYPASLKCDDCKSVFSVPVKIGKNYCCPHCGGFEFSQVQDTAYESLPDYGDNFENTKIQRKRAV